jgi:hypothetical protein
MSKVVATKTTSRTGGLILCDRHVTEVILDDGRTGRGVSGDFATDGDKMDSLSKAIQDANSKPTPKN